MFFKRDSVLIIITLICFELCLRQYGVGGETIDTATRNDRITTAVFKKFQKRDVSMELLSTVLQATVNNETGEYLVDTDRLKELGSSDYNIDPDENIHKEVVRLQDFKRGRIISSSGRRLPIEMERPITDFAGIINETEAMDYDNETRFDDEEKYSYTDESYDDYSGNGTSDFFSCPDAFCNFNGKCYADKNRLPFCSCDAWYLGSNCKINSIVIVIGILAALCVLMLCITLLIATRYCRQCRYRKRRSDTNNVHQLHELTTGT